MPVIQLGLSPARRTRFPTITRFALTLSERRPCAEDAVIDSQANAVMSFWTRDAGLSPRRSAGDSRGEPLRADRRRPAQSRETEYVPT